MRLEFDKQTFTLPVDLSRRDIHTLFDLVDKIRRYQESGANVGCELPDLTTAPGDEDVLEVLRTALTNFDAFILSEPAADERQKIIQCAKNIYEGQLKDDLKIPDVPNLAPASDGSGCWVEAYVWIAADEYGGVDYCAVCDEPRAECRCCQKCGAYPCECK